MAWTLMSVGDRYTSRWLLRDASLSTYSNCKSLVCSYAESLMRLKLGFGKPMQPCCQIRSMILSSFRSLWHHPAQIQLIATTIAALHVGSLSGILKTMERALVRLELYWEAEASGPEAAHSCPPLQGCGFPPRHPTFLQADTLCPPH